MGERLQKVLAQHGLGSRRQIESWMREGRVLLNDAPAAPGAQFAPGDRVKIDGRDVTARLAIEAAPAVLVYNKPVGEAVVQTGAEPESVLARLPAGRGERWVPVNRMSPGDSGLVLFTNDGRLANALMRSAASLPAVYMVRAHPGGGTPAPEALSTTVNLDEGPVQFEAVEAAGGEGANQWFRVVAQGADRRHAVRALFESQDMTVSRVIQLRFADVELPRDLPRGRHRRLSPEFVARLYERAGLEAPPVEEKKPSPRRAGTRRGASQSPAADRPRRGKPPTRKRR